jgi:hypothetical protein
LLTGAVVRRADGHVPGLVVPHVLAVCVMAGLAWFVRQPIQGDMAFWSPAAATFLIGAMWLVAGGSFGLLRWASYRALMLADVAALPAVFFGSLGFTFVIGIVIAILLLVGLAMTWRARRAARSAELPRPRTVGWPALALLVAPVAVWWWYGFTVAYDFVGTIVNYGIEEVMIGGLVGAAVVLWLDRRPGLLLGSAVTLVYYGALNLSNGIDGQFPEAILDGVVFVASGLFAIFVSGRDIVARLGIGMLIPVGVAAATVAVVLVQPLLTPLVVVAALVLERSAADAAAPAVRAAPASP